MNPTMAVFIVLHSQLLANEIRCEQNTLLQCIRYTVMSRFFGAGDTGKSLTVGEGGGEGEGREVVVEETGEEREEEGVHLREKGGGVERSQ